MLEDLINNLRCESSLLIKDSLRKSGACLIKSLTNQALSQQKPLLYINTEPLFSNRHSLGSLGVQNVDVFGQYDSLKERIMSSVSSANTVVVFPSISLLLLSYSVGRFAKLLRALRESDKVSSVIALMHTDVVLNEEIVDRLDYLFSSIIHVLLPESELSVYYAQVKCLRRKSNGKLETSEEYFTLDDACSLKLVHSSSSAVVRSYTQSQSGDVVSSLTFNLSLSDKEREAKNRLHLPYLKKDSEKQALLSQTHNGSSGRPLISIGDESSQTNPGGKIYYHYDEADDFDDEDPDDDLDI
ncbi:ELP5 [Bugula neritina]|uniref:Elongator complex protein 5 n=1 Tax=Bugula neritina TaxID=10212 RepID=A0A7J7K0S3_BUGNE|nr:ELP5 [Bugula neritina]